MGKNIEGVANPVQITWGVPSAKLPLSTAAVSAPALPAEEGSASLDSTVLEGSSEVIEPTAELEDESGWGNGGFDE
jgi:hypothetical protein